MAARQPEQVILRHTTGSTTVYWSEPVKPRLNPLLRGDPDWSEFKRRWAAKHGPVGDEV